MAALAQPRADDRKRPQYAWEGSPFGVILLDAEGHIVHSNEAMRSITGYDAGELARLPVASYTHPDDVLEAVSSFRRLLAGETDSYRLKTRLIRKGGGTVWVDSYVTTTQETPGAPWTAVWMVHDITSHKLAELALRDQNARLSRVVETQAELAAADLGLEGVAQLVAERAQELTGADGATVSILDGEKLVTHVATGSSGGAAQFSVPLLHRGRNVGSLDVAKGADVTDEDRRTVELLAVILSSAVSEAAEREARREQVQSLARFETIFERAPIGMGLLSLGGQLRTTNSAMREITGASAEELARVPIMSHTVPEDVDGMVELFAGMVEGKYDSYRHEFRLYAKSGEVIWVDGATALLRDADGKPQGAVTMVHDITSHKLAELALRDQNARLSRVVETQAELAAADLGLEGVAQLVAERAQELTGADGATVSILDGEKLVIDVATGSSGGAAQFSVPLLHGGRNVGSLGVAKGADVTDEDRRTVELLAVLLSSAVSEAAESEARLEQVEALARFETIFERAPIGMGLLSLGGRLRTTNSAMREITGRSAEELARVPVASYTAPEDVDQVVELFTGMLEGKHDSYRQEHRLYAKNGEVVWVDSATELLRDAEGKPQSAVTMAQNITSHKLAELALRDQNARLSRVVETQAELAAADLGLEGVAQLVAERAQELTGADGATVSILDGEKLVIDVATGSSGGAAQFSVPLLHGGRKVGSLGVAKGADVTDEDRRTVGLLAVLLSSAVSEAAESEARREQVEALARFETIFERAPIGMGLLSLGGRLRTTNSVMREITGRSAEELASRNMIEYTVPEDVDEVVERFMAMVEGKYDSYHHEHRLYAKNGEVVWVDTATALLRDAEGKPQSAVTMAQNITQRRATEEQLHQSQKLDAIGQLTAGIAHDFNNLLLGMLGYTELAQAEVGADGPAAEYLRRVESCAQRAATLTGQLLAFGRRQALHLRPLELNVLVSETVAMLHSILGERIELVTVLDPTLDAVRADDGQMQQVLLNFALNARDAMPDGGTLTIRTNNADVGAGEPCSGELESGRYVVLSVEDEGCGMTHEVREQIFDPFFTTKGVGKGTGLGLSSTLGIVKQSGGHIEVASEPGRGSAFHTYLPALPAALAEEESAREPLRVLSQASQGAGRRILVVEDEDVVRTLLARTLERLGYAVETAEDPSFALPTLRERGDEFALVISDMVMPNMTGVEFAREVAEWKPELPFVFMSGYTGDVDAQPGADAGGLFLQKPFTSEALATTVRKALEHSA